MNIRKQKIWLAGLLSLLLLTGCQSQSANEPQSTESTEQVVYASFYPIYALSEMILQDIPDMKLMQLVQPQDGCLRSYQLSDWDLYQVAFNADAVILGGRGLESFAGAMQSLGDEGPAVVTMFQNLELHNNGKQAVDEDSSHLADENPHLYLSARALPAVLESLHAYMQELDPAYGDLYTLNLNTAMERANGLISEYDEAVREIDHTVPVALMNEALIYPANDLELNVVCRIDRESGENLYSSELTDAIHTLREVNVSVVLIEKQVPDSLVNALTEQGFEVVKLDILSTGRAEMGADGYFEAMLANLAAIKQALSR